MKKIEVIHYDRYYKAKLYWFRDGRLNGIAEWIKVTS